MTIQNSPETLTKTGRQDRPYVIGIRTPIGWESKWRYSLTKTTCERTKTKDSRCGNRTVYPSRSRTWTGTGPTETLDTATVHPPEWGSLNGTTRPKSRTRSGYVTVTLIR